MFKKILLITLLSAAIGLLIFGAVTRTSATTETAAAGGQGYGGGNGGGRGRLANPQSGFANEVNHAEELNALPPADPGSLSAAESADLLFMREEEKLARDVYAALYSKWGLRTFQNISASEQTHMDSLKVLLDRYNLPDSASSQPGVFTHPELQALYNSLMARGSQSLAEALKVAVEIEELDILDLQKRLAQTDNADIQFTYNNLLRGSNNHLRTFTGQLQNQAGQGYTTGGGQGNRAGRP